MKALKKMLSFSVYRVVLIVFAVLTPLNMLTVALGQRVVVQAETQVSLRSQHALRLQISRIDDALKRINTQLAALAIDDPDYLRLALRDIDSEEERYRQLQNVVDLQLTLRERQEDIPLVTGVFVYFPEKDIFANYSSHANELQYIHPLVLDALAADPAPYRTGKLVTVQDEPYLLSLAQRRGTWCGAWIKLLDEDVAPRLEEGCALAVTDREGAVSYTTVPVGETLAPQETRLRVGGKQYLQTAVPSDYADYCLVELQPRSAISGALPAALRLLQILSILTVAALPLILYAIQRWVISPVRGLTEAIERIENGEMEYRIPEQSTGAEFTRINRSFNHMMDQVEALKISVYEEQLQAQKIKMGFLAQQIKPHFILNTLNILYSYEREEFPLIQKMILYLSRYFRYVVNAHQDFVTLGQEMEHLRNYFAIQKLRFVQTFEAAVDYDEELYDCLVPPLLLQSFAENAIKHALIPDTIVQIRVSAEKTEAGRLLLRVTDTGPGITDEVLERIEQFRKEHRFRRDLGVGIQNAIDRVDLLYSGAGSVELSRRPEGGTAVEIELPFLKMHSRLADADEETA